MAPIMSRLACGLLMVSGMDALRRGTKDRSPIHMEQESGSEFRGAFRDLSLWVDKQDKLESMDSAPDIDLWVIEYNTEEQLDAERVRAEQAGLVVALQEKLSLVVEGNVPAVLGYDACGGNTDKTVISVPAFAVEPRPMPQATAQKYLEAARESNPAIVKILDDVSEESIAKTLDNLQTYQTRRSESGEVGLNPAAEWVVEQLTKYGFKVSRDKFRNDMTPQIIAELTGEVEPEKVVVYGAHLDSTAGFWAGKTGRSPGADDNGSGSTAVLEFAKIVATQGLRFRNTLRLCLFTGEEQGLIGSRALARRWKSEGVNVIAMFNTDMLGYRQPGTPITINFMNRVGDQDLINIAREVTHTYLPGIENDNTAACCSDQQSFHENGFPAVGYFETPGRTVYYPQYHRTSDLLEYLDTEQIATQAKAAYAATALMAEVM